MSPPQLSSSPPAITNTTPMTRPVAAFLLLFLLLLLAASYVEAQSPPSSNESSNSNDISFKRGDFNQTMAIIILVAASTFFFVFYITFICRSGSSMTDLAAAAAAAYAIENQRRQRGLDPSVLETFPILVYSEVKEHKIGKGALECAICLIEFEDDDIIRLLPQCDHVFHQSCIDAWLLSHVTCPVCRTNYAAYTTDPPATAAAAAQDEEASPAAAADHIVDISVDEERKAEMMELARIAIRVRGSGSRWPRRLPRSHSTGHSVVMQQGERTERYTLRLPENLRKEIIAAGNLKRATTFGATGGVGEGNSHRRRSLNLGRFEGWPSFFRRSMSAARVSVWAGSVRQGEEGPVLKEGSSTAKGGLVMEATLNEESTRGKFASARSSLDCLGGGRGGSKDRHNVDPEEWSTVALNRV